MGYVVTILINDEMASVFGGIAIFVSNLSTASIYQVREVQLVGYSDASPNADMQQRCLYEQ